MKSKQIDKKNKLEKGKNFKISPFKELIKRTYPHKHEGYYEFIFLSEGQGYHIIETEEFMIKPPEFYFLKPGQLHYWQFTAIPKGFVLLINDFEFNPLTEQTHFTFLHKISEITRISFPANTYPYALLQNIFNEYVNNKNYSREIIHGLLYVLFGKLLQITETTERQTNQRPSLYDKFRNLLTSECPRLHKVHEFASLLHTTPQNLNATVRKHVSFNASTLIAQQIYLDAKRYLLHTDNTISEIADYLHFTDTSNFVKFFKKHEGMTPVQFRDTFFKNTI